MGETVIIPALEKAEKDVRALSVPASWKDIHKEQISLLASQRLAITYLINAEKDSLRALYGLAIIKGIQTDADAWKAEVSEKLRNG
jgi:hypothetical protein